MVTITLTPYQVKILLLVVERMINIDESPKRARAWKAIWNKIVDAANSH